MAGGTVSRTAHFALHRMPLDAAASRQSPTGPGSDATQALFAVREPWIGALVPKRWAKRAVTRNAIKRQIYTVSQTFEPPPARRRPRGAAARRLRPQAVRQRHVRRAQARRARRAASSCSPGRAAMIRAVLIALVKGYRLLLAPGWARAAASRPPVPPIRCRRCEQHGAAAGSYLTLRAPGALPSLVRRRARSECRRGRKAAPVHPSALTPFQEEVFMNDIRRTILWVIFGFSMVMLWDQWQIHNGNKPTFFLGQPKPHGHGAGAGRRRVRRSAPAPSLPAPSAAPPAPPPAAGAPPATAAAAPRGRARRSPSPPTCCA